MTQLYKVIASDSATAIVALQGADGYCHLGRALDVVPEDRDVLLGPPPSIGLHPLKQIAGQEKLYSVVLVLINCDPDPAVKVVTVSRQ
jgi:hypothetical protein